MENCFLIWIQNHWDAIFLSVGGLLFWFVLIYAAIHYFRIYRKPFTEVQWKYVDYVWLAFAAIGVVTAINTVEMQRHQDVYQYARTMENRGASVLTTNLKVLAQSDICRIKDATTSADPALTRVCRYYDDRLDLDGNDRPNLPKVTKLQQDLLELGSGGDFKFVAKLGATLQSAERYEAMIEDTDAAKEKLSPTITFLVMQAMTPLMLIIALALRTAKVTGEIMVKDSTAFGWLRKAENKPSSSEPEPEPELEPVPEPGLDNSQVGAVVPVNDDAR